MATRYEGLMLLACLLAGTRGGGRGGAFSRGPAIRYQSLKEPRDRYGLEPMSEMSEAHLWPVVAPEYALLGVS